MIEDLTGRGWGCQIGPERKREVQKGTVEQKGCSPYRILIGAGGTDPKRNSRSFPRWPILENRFGHGRLDRQDNASATDHRS